MSESDKCCIIMLDEMSVKSEITYCRGTDKLVGVEDTGKTRTGLPATSALTVLVRGIKGKWKQALMYALVSSKVNSATIQDIILDCINQLKSVGLNVKAVTSDQ